MSSPPTLAFLALLAILVSSSFAAKVTLYSLKVNDIRGQPVNLESFKGKTLLIVNTASQCGYTDSHFKALDRLQRIMQEDNKPFEILAFPCNDFGAQEPWEPEEIETFARTNYHCQFPIMEKVKIVENSHPLWKFIKDTSWTTPTWNFHKYLFDSKGKFVDSWDAKVPVEAIFDKILAVVDGPKKKQKNKPEL